MDKYVPNDIICIKKGGCRLPDGTKLIEGSQAFGPWYPKDQFDPVAIAKLIKMGWIEDRKIGGK